MYSCITVVMVRQTNGGLLISLGPKCLYLATYFIIIGAMVLIWNLDYPNLVYGP